MPWLHPTSTACRQLDLANIARGIVRNTWMYNQRNAYSSPTVLGIEERFERPLCYVLGWVSGLFFLLIEKRNAAVRRHAYQSVVVFGALSLVFLLIALIGFATGWIPLLGGIIGAGLGFIGFIATIVGVLAWLILMVLAFISPETFIGGPRRDLI
jgi:uncharacterized membrane protein